MATALVSSLSKRPVRHDIAMTGEITLNGRVLPIGGVKEKVLGGVRAGITTVILPKDNEHDIDDIPPEVRERIVVVFVSELAEVLALALRDGSMREGRLLFPGLSPDDVVPLTDPPALTGQRSDETKGRPRGRPFFARSGVLAGRSWRAQLLAGSESATSSSAGRSGT